jgi:hypothetical protein
VLSALIVEASHFKQICHSILNQMEIKQGMSYAELNNQFVQMYPFLKLRFFQKLKNKLEEIPNDTPIKTKEVIQVDCSSNKSIEQLIAELQYYLNIQVQIFRRSGNVYIETSRTSRWTLKRQNDEGEELSASS